jgi:hypothetical protein
MLDIVAFSPSEGASIFNCGRGPKSRRENNTALFSNWELRNKQIYPRQRSYSRLHSLWVKARLKKYFLGAMCGKNGTELQKKAGITLTL